MYSLFGLAISSAVPLPCPEWQPLGARADVELFESTGQQLSQSCHRICTRFEEDGFWECSMFEDGAARVCWKDHFDFVVSGDGRRVLWQRLMGVPDEVLFTYLLGQVLSFCLLVRGLEPLHATSIVVDGQAIALLGDCGYGKSTLAAGLMARGYPLLTDDVLLLQFDGQTVLAHPSLARVKLTPGSADAVFRGSRSIPMNRFTHKMIFPLTASQHVSHPVPLRALYLLPRNSSRSRVLVRRVNGRAAFLPIIKSTFNNSVVSAPRLKRQFAFASRLVKAVPIKRLCYPKRLDLLPAVVDAILADLSRESKPQ
ncbi:MAG: hypothetical protein LAO06_04335 [Acidobacteriia bacterium]|nr:hypothetical protein [Terriglobia bacterium]